MKNLHLEIRWVYEWRYNPYKNVSKRKKRPILVWCNKSKYLSHKMFCFYCSTKFDKYNKKCCVKISKALNNSFKWDTYVWIHKPILVDNADVIKNCWQRIDNKQTRENIEQKVEELFSKFIYSTLPNSTHKK